MRIEAEQTQCMIIDMQEKLMAAMSGRKRCESRAIMLIKGLRVLGIPMLVTQQYTMGLGNSIPEVFEAVEKRNILIKEPSAAQKMKRYCLNFRRTIKGSS